MRVTLGSEGYFCPHVHIVLRSEPKTSPWLTPHASNDKKKKKKKKPIKALPWSFCKRVIHPVLVITYNIWAYITGLVTSAYPTIYLLPTRSGLLLRHGWRWGWLNNFRVYKCRWDWIPSFISLATRLHFSQIAIPPKLFWKLALCKARTLAKWNIHPIE